ncbi:MAG: flagellar hook-length control protein FliK [Desulfobulbus sp.]
MQTATSPKSSPQKNTASKDQENGTVPEESVTDTKQKSRLTENNKVTKNKKESNEKISTDISESGLAENEQQSIANVNAQKAEDSSLQIAAASSPPSNNSKESVVSQMLSSITNSPEVQEKNSALPTIAIAQNEEKTLGPTTADPAISAMEPTESPSSSTTPFLVQPQPSTSPDGGSTPSTTTNSGTTLGANQVLVDGSLPFTIENQPTDNTTTTNTIVFDSSNGSITTTTETNPLLDDGSEDQGLPLVVQNKYGQIITIEQNKESLLPSTGVNGLAGNQLFHRGANHLDLNNYSIHSHLPNEINNKTTATLENSTPNNQQPQSNLFNGRNQDIQIMNAFDQQSGIQDANIQTQNAQNLTFNNQTNTSQTSTTTWSTTSPVGGYYQLGSGTLVPEGAVVDQMIAHFSVNKRLETGSVNLKLYPQELGELRMEIKVEQDNVKAHIVVQSPHAQEMIDRHMPRLREMLEQQGLHLQQIEITVATNDNASGEPFQDNSAWQQAHQALSHKSTHSDFSIELEEEIVENDQINNNLNVIA